jgi:hypothetical protein
LNFKREFKEFPLLEVSAGAMKARTENRRLNFALSIFQKRQARAEKKAGVSRKSLVRPRCALPACHSVLLMPTSLTVVAVDAANPSNLPTPLSSPRVVSGRPAFSRPAVG